MLETIALILIVLWLLGMVSSYTMGGFIHILLVIAIIAIALRLIRGKSMRSSKCNELRKFSVGIACG